jgi:uncharacterized protein (TIGR00730 family)
MTPEKLPLDTRIEDKVRELVHMAECETNHPLQEMILTLIKIAKNNPDFHDINLIHQTLKELWQSYRVFLPYRDARKVCIFGSARTPEDHPAYQITLDFAKKITDRGFMAITGAGGGIMEAGNRGAQVNKSFGANILLPFEQAPNPYIANSSKLVSFKYFFTRKLTFIKESDATVLCPGGFGTHDEAFEVLTLVQTGRCAPRPIILLTSPGDDYWEEFLTFLKKALLKNAYIAEEDLAIFHNTTSADDAVSYIADFYKVYHSIRYQDKHTIIRINHPISEEKLAQLNDKFTDILISGKIEQVDAKEVPYDNQVFQHLPRLIMHSQKTSFGKVYEFIHYLNQL